MDGYNFYENVYYINFDYFNFFYLKKNINFMIDIFFLIKFFTKFFYIEELDIIFL